MDLMWQDCDGVEEPIGYEKAPQVEWCPAIEYSVPVMECRLCAE